MTTKSRNDIYTVIDSPDPFSLVGHLERPRRLSPLSLNFLSSAFHGSHTAPYFLRSCVSSSRCSFCRARNEVKCDPPQVRRKIRKDTHEVQGLLATVHIRKDLFQLMPFQALRSFEGTHDILLQRIFQLVFVRVGPPPAVIEKEPVPGDRVVDALTIFDLLPCAIGK